jgi:tetratricopeptide (TPR) repeat protein
MKMKTALWGLTLMVISAFVGRIDFSTGRPGTTLWLGAAPALAAAPQTGEEKKQPQWKSRDEYDAFQAMATEQDPNKKISLADAFLEKFADSDFKDLVHVQILTVHQQLGDSEKAIEAARKTLEVNPDRLEALSYLSFAFPFVFKSNGDPEAESKLSAAESNARHGLEVLQQVQKPESVSDDQFNQYIKSQRANFNNTLGFVALQRKDYPAAITSFKAGAEDNPADIYSFYRMGLAYLYSETPDYDNAVWNMARSVSLAKASNNPAGAEIEKFLSKVYVGFHGNEEGLPEIVAQAATSPTPPEGFKVEPMPVPEVTGNPSVDAFNQMAVPLKLGGPRAQEIWSQLKGQPIEMAGFVDSIEKAAESNVYLVRIDLRDASKTTEGVYDIELKNSTQPNVKNLGSGDGVHFKGTLGAYTATPSFVLTLENGEIDPDEIPDRPRSRR